MATNKHRRHVGAYYFWRIRGHAFLALGEGVSCAAVLVGPISVPAVSAAALTRAILAPACSLMPVLSITLLVAAKTPATS